MIKREYLPDFVLALVSVGVGLAVAVAVLATGYFPVAKASLLLESNCKGNSSFYLPTSLYAEEENAYSNNAKAFSFLSSSGSWMRVITDYEVSGDGRKASFLVTFKGVSGHRIDFRDLMFSVDFNDGVTHGLSGSSEGSAGGLGLLTVTGERDISDQDLSADLILGGDGSCQGKIPGALVISPRSDSRGELAMQGVKILKGNQSGDYSFPKGYTPIGFASWRYLKAFTDEGLTVLKYDENNRGWVLNPQNKSYFAEPGIGYLIYNPSDKVVKVRSAVPYYVPPTVADHRVTKGWNLLYNDTGNDTFASKIALLPVEGGDPGRDYIKNKVSLQMLVESGQADPKILYLPKDYSINSGFDAVDISDNNFKGIIPDASFFWVYLYDYDRGERPSKVPFSISLRGGGDSFGQNQFIQFEVEVKNESDMAVAMPDKSQQDPCSIGLEFFNASGEKISSDFDKKECPLWPKTVDIKQGESISYNYSWKPGRKVDGEVLVRAYFDYTRLGASDILYNESKVNIR